MVDASAGHDNFAAGEERYRAMLDRRKPAAKQRLLVARDRCDALGNRFDLLFGQQIAVSRHGADAVLDRKPHPFDRGLQPVGARPRPRLRPPQGYGRWRIAARLSW
jgi:hypothetical protein